MIISPAFWAILISQLFDLKIRNFFFEKIGVRKNGFVSHELRAADKRFRKPSLYPLVKFLVVFAANTVPELRFASVKNVDRSHV